MGGTQWCVEGGTGKAEAAKLQGAGISPSDEPKENLKRKKGMPKFRNVGEKEDPEGEAARIEGCNRRRIGSRR